MVTTVLHGIDQSVPSFAKLPAKGHWGAKVVTEDLQAPFAWDDIAKLWVPDGVIRFMHAFAVHGGAQGAISLGITVPSGILILDGILEVVTSYAGATATVALKIEAANDVLAATAVGSLSVGRVAIVPVNTPATIIKTTATRTITATVATADLTAGKMYGYLRCARALS